jgi:ATP-dependent helicase HepA
LNDHPARYQLGDVVCLRADTERCGPVIAVLPPVGGHSRYRVFHSVNDIREYHEEQLIDQSEILADPGSGDLPIPDMNSSIFRARLTGARLSHPLIDSLYSLHAARIRYVPFQMKPLLRFLRADRPRLLIADEVGVGKTIEAGLILRELQTRQQVDNVLIVCPKALVSKWRMEMRRFDEDFRPLTSESLRYCLQETELDGTWPQQYARAIVHLELLRTEDHLYGRDGRHRTPGLLTLSPAPSFSLVIVDEAHHLRNPDSKSFEVARFLSDASEAMVFLSATPVHLRAENLFSLLNLLRPDLFPDFSVFQTMLEPNQHLNAALRIVRRRAPASTWQTDAADELAMAARTDWGQHVLINDPRFASWERKLRSLAPMTDDERVGCLRDLEDVHSLAHVMNRTRRRDIGRFTIREPHAVRVPFTSDQQMFYDALMDFRRDVLRHSYDEFVVRMIMDTMERQASSCLPALIPILDRFLQGESFDLSILTDVDDVVSNGHPERPFMPTAQKAQRVRELAAGLRDDDPKLDQLRLIIDDTLRLHGPGKVLVFSFFLHTLGYLQNHLYSSGYRIATITGQTADLEREHLRDRFRLPRTDPDAIDVLLSSEVGCEGLDYEFCDRLVNYDIPWNPMRIEQRIGRIDRFGQRSDKVQIFNFITPGTVEERIFYRCFDRIGIFHDTVGELENILGDLVSELTQTALNPQLSSEQAEALAQQQVDNAIRHADEQRRLEEEGANLLGLEQSFTEEIDALESSGQVVSSADLVQMIGEFLRVPEFAGLLAQDGRDELIHRIRLNRDGRSAMLPRIRMTNVTGRPLTQFVRWLEGDDPHLLVTFDQQYAAEHRDVPFITPIHPLARAAAGYWDKQQSDLVAHLTATSNDVRAGRYAFAAYLWETIAIRPEVRLVTIAWDIDRSQPAHGVAESLLSILKDATDIQYGTEFDGEAANAVTNRIDEEAHQRRTQALAELREHNSNLVDRRIASLDAFYQSRLRRIQSDHESATNPRIIRMRSAEREGVEREYAQRLAALQQRRNADIISQRIASGLLEITRGEPDAE